MDHIFDGWDHIGNVYIPPIKDKKITEDLVIRKSVKVKKEVMESAYYEEETTVLLNRNGIK